MKAASWLERRYLDTLFFSAVVCAGPLVLVAMIAMLWAISCVVPQGWTIDTHSLAADLEDSVPVGGTIDDARAWGRRHGFPLIESPDEANPQQVEWVLAYQSDAGWLRGSEVVVKIRFDRSGRVSRRGVEREIND